MKTPDIKEDNALFSVLFIVNSKSRRLKAPLSPYLLISLFIFLIIFIVHAQTGTVLEQGTNAPIRNAIVTIPSTGDMVVTDNQGKFVFTNISVKHFRKNSNAPISYVNGMLQFESMNTPVKVQLFNFNGKLIKTINAAKGTKQLYLPEYFKSSNIYIVKVLLNNNAYSFTTCSVGNTPNRSIFSSASNSVSFSPSISLSQSSSLILNISCYGYVPVTITDASPNTIRLQKYSGEIIPPGMKAIAAGTFTMGSGVGSPAETPRHDVTLSRFYMDSTEVTQADYETLMKVTPWHSYKEKLFIGGTGKRLPAWNLTWNDAVLYCNARSKRDGLDTLYTYETLQGTAGDGCTLTVVKTNFTKRGYRLPTEAEWEYAARAGTTTEYFWGDKLDSTSFPYVLDGKRNNGATYPVASLLPNNFGLYDIAGNVEELINDYFSSYTYSNVKIYENPKGPESAEIDGIRVVRGGSWRHGGDTMRCARRLANDPFSREFDNDQGVRPVLQLGN